MGAAGGMPGMPGMPENIGEILNDGEFQNFFKNFAGQMMGEDGPAAEGKEMSEDD